MLASKISFNKQDYGKAVEISKGVLNDLKMANDTKSEFDQQRFMAQAQSKLAQLEESDQVSASVQAQEIFKSYDDLKKYYDDHPTWMSFRRYGKLKQRIEKNGEFDVIDADTEKELAETLRFYTEQGWKQVGKRQVVEKKLQGQYYLNDALLKIMQDREGQFKTMLQEANIPEEEKARLMAVPSATSAMISEINSRELYRPTKGRKLTGDLERFDWWEQFQRYTPAALAAAQRRALGAKINYWMQNPELNGLKMQKDQFMALYEQSKKPDPEWARKWNKLTDDERVKIMQYIPRYIKSQPDNKYRKDASTFLNKRAWEDEIIGEIKIVEKPVKVLRQMDFFNYSDYVLACQEIGITPKPAEKW